MTTPHDFEPTGHYEQATTAASWRPTTDPQPPQPAAPEGEGWMLLGTHAAPDPAGALHVLFVWRRRFERPRPPAPAPKPRPSKPGKGTPKPPIDVD